MKEAGERPKSIVELAKEHLLENVKRGGEKFAYLPRHITQVERWARWLTDLHPEANLEVVMISVFMHDIGQIVGEDTDHAVNSETEARRWLTEMGYPQELMEQVVHCARAHRCKDVMPATPEAKIIASADSASHLTDTVYIDMCNRGERENAIAKLERDIRDVGSFFPELDRKMKPLYEAWRKLLGVYPEP